MTKTTVSRTNDREYGSVANGMQVGSGFDCKIKRVSGSRAIVNVLTPNGDRDWLGMLDVDEDQDLQVTARDIANCPADFLADCVTPQSDDWDELADMWNAIEVR